MMMELKELKEILLKKIESQCGENLKAGIKEKCDLFLNNVIFERRNGKFGEKTCEMIAVNTNLGEQVEYKESEMVEYKEGDLREAQNYAEYMKMEEKKLTNEFYDKQSQIFEAYCQSEAAINDLCKYQKRFKEIPAILESEQLRTGSTLQNENFKLDSVLQASRDCHEQEKSFLAQISDIEMKSNEVLRKSKQLEDSIKEENIIRERITEYKEQIIPQIASEIEKIKTNVSNIEKVIDEKNEAKSEAAKLFDDLNTNFQIERTKGTSLNEQLEYTSKLKDDLMNKNVLLIDAESDENMKKIIFTKEYKKQKEAIRRLTVDNDQISKDVEMTKNKANELVTILEKLKEEMQKEDEMSQAQKEEIMLLDKDKNDKQAELDSLTEEKLKVAKDIETSEMEKEFIKSNIVELASVSKEIAKQIKQSFERGQIILKKANIKAIDVKKHDKHDKSKNKLNVQKWLKDLPQKFTKTSSKSGDVSPNSTIDFEMFNMNSENKVQSSEISAYDNQIFNLEIEDPETLDANMDCSFSDLNGSEYGLDDSVMNSEIFKL